MSQTAAIAISKFTNNPSQYPDKRYEARVKKFSWLEMRIDDKIKLTDKKIKAAARIFLCALSVMLKKL